MCLRSLDLVSVVERSVCFNLSLVVRPCLGGGKVHVEYAIVHNELSQPVYVVWHMES